MKALGCAPVDQSEPVASRPVIMIMMRRRALGGRRRSRAMRVVSSVHGFHLSKLAIRHGGQPAFMTCASIIAVTMAWIVIEMVRGQL